MYNNIYEKFNYWPKLCSKIAVFYMGFSVVFGIFGLLGTIISGMELFFIIQTLMGVVIAVFIFLYFLKVSKAQKILKTAYMGKVLKKKFGYTDDQIDLALAKIDSEVTHPIYTDTNTKNTFMITENWVIGAAGAFMQAAAVPIAEIKEFNRLVVETRRKGTSSYGYYLKISNRNDDAINIRLGNTDLLDEASYQLNAALKKIQ